MSEPLIRKAIPSDAREIFEARSRSIMELCKNEYSEDQLKAWAYSDYQEGDIDRFIKESTTWVVSLHDRVEGVAQLMNTGEIKLLYLTKAVAGKKLGKKLMANMEQRAKELKLSKLWLRSSKTAHGFYKSCGFIDSSKEIIANVRGAEVPCIDMIKLTF